MVNVFKPLTAPARYVGRWAKQLAQRFTGYPISSDFPYGVFGQGQMTAAGKPISQDTAMTISAVYAAVEIRSSIKACLPLGVYRKLGDQREPADMHPATRVLSIEPNPEMTPQNFWQTLEMHKLLWGNAYAEIEWTLGGNVRALWPIEPWRVWPERLDGELYFVVDGTRRIQDKDILRSPHLSYDGVCGRSVITWARESLGLTVAAQDYGATFFGSGGVPSGVLEHPGSPKPETRKQMRKEWQEVHAPTSGGKNNETAVLWEGMKYNRISLPPGDAQFLDTRRFQVTEIARWFNVPPHMLRDLERATFSNIEHQQIEFVLYSLLPGLIGLEQEIDRKLLTPPRLYSKYSVRGLLRGDLKAQAEFFTKMFGVGVYSVNEIKQYLDENGIGEDGDVHFVPLNMQDIRIAADLEANQAKIADGTSPPEPPAETPAEPPADSTESEIDPNAPGETPAPGPGLAANGRAAPAIAVSRVAVSIKSDRGAAPDLAISVSQEFMSDTLARLLRKEAKDAERAASDPRKFLAWMDKFYEHHATVCSEALATPLKWICCASGELLDTSAPELVSAFVAQHISESRSQLLAAAECQPAELPAKVAACVATWEQTRTKVDFHSVLKGIAL
jgi:HK97 family phage portal protein